MKQGETDVLMGSKFNEERMNLYVLSIQFFGNADLPVHLWNNQSLSLPLSPGKEVASLPLPVSVMREAHNKKKKKKTERGISKVGGGGGSSDLYFILCDAWRKLASAHDQGKTKNKVQRSSLPLVFVFRRSFQGRRHR